MTELHLPGNNSLQLIPPIFLFFGFFFLMISTILAKHCDSDFFIVLHAHFDAKSLRELIN